MQFKYNCKYKDLRSQVIKIQEECKELELAYLDNKYQKGEIEEIGLEALDTMRACYTLIKNNFNKFKIKELLELHNEKIKSRL